MYLTNNKSDVNNFIGRKTKEDFNYPLCFVLLSILTKNYFKYNQYTNFTHRDIADKINYLFKNLIPLKGWRTNEKELDLKVRIELYKLREYQIVKFIPLKKKDTYSIIATDRANDFLLKLNYAFCIKGHFNDNFKGNFYKAKIKFINKTPRIEVNFTNKKGSTNNEY
nr:hypothetical protein [uncultured Mediterranean phage uvMED]